MPDEQDSTRDPYADSPQPPPVEPTIEQRVMTIESKSLAHMAQDDNAKEMKREFRLVEIVTIAANLILAVVGIFALRAYYGQLDAMNGQLTAMQAQLEQMKGSGGQTDRLLGLYQRQIEELEKSVQESRRLADETHSANENSVRSDRPWLAIIISITDFGPEKTPMKEVSVINSGKRPALITKLSAGGDYFKAMSENPMYEKQIPIRQLLVPGTHYESVVKLFKSGILTAPAFSAIDSNLVNFYSFAEVEYSDIGTGKRYYTHACVKYTPATQQTSAQFTSCPAYNYGN